MVSRSTGPFLPGFPSSRRRDPLPPSAPRVQISPWGGRSLTVLSGSCRCSVLPGARGWATALLLPSPAGSFSGPGHLWSSEGRGRSPLLSLLCSLLAVTGPRRGPRPRAHVALKAPAVATPDVPGPQLREGVLEELRRRRGQAPGQKAALLSMWVTPSRWRSRELDSRGVPSLSERFLWSPEACSVSRPLTRSSFCRGRQSRACGNKQTQAPGTQMGQGASSGRFWLPGLKSLHPFPTWRRQEG